MQRLLDIVKRNLLAAGIGVTIIMVWHLILYLVGLAIGYNIHSAFSLVGAFATLVALEYYADKLG